MALRCPSIQRLLRALAFVAVVLFFLQFRPFNAFPFSGRRYDMWKWTPCPPGSSPFKQSCDIPRASIRNDLQIIVKTGGSEPPGRLQQQLKTLLAGVPPENLLILSDLEEDVGEYHIHDMYADVSKNERKNYPEFELYEKQLAYKAQGKDTRELKGGWQLDKYKNLPMKRKIWRMQQEHIQRKKWFIFIDTDTYVEWDNLFALLEHLDSSDELYMGSPVWVTETNPDFKYQFAHGGSGYVLSYGALEALNTPESYDVESPMYSQYGLNVTALCCGDKAVSIALLTKGIRMKGYWPLFNGEIPATVPFGKEHWCEPVISLHHIGEGNLDALWHWILDWKHRTMNQEPLLWRDLYEYVSPQFTSRRDDWDNIEKLDTKLDLESFEDCKAACRADKLCFQFVFHGKTCELSHSIRYGRPHESENNDDRYFSGWDMKRIQEWTSKTKCTSAHWVKSNP